MFGMPELRGASEDMRRDGIRDWLVNISAACAVVLLVVLCPPAGPASAAGEDTEAPSAEETRVSETSTSLESLDWVVDSLLAKPDVRGTEISILVESLETGAVLY